MDQKEFALIVAGGKGTRMDSTTPKQFMEMDGRPVLFHTLDAFLRYSPTLPIVLVLPVEDVVTWHKLVQQHQYNHRVTIQTGGPTRFQSVKRGLEKIPGEGLVAVHDGVRPLVSSDIIGTSFRLARLHQSAVAAVELKESIRMVAGIPKGSQEKSQAMDRSAFRIIQTPQTFNLELIRKAYQVKEDSQMTDDASVVERTGHAVTLFEGSYDNIKITTAADLIIAEALLKRKG